MPKVEITGASKRFGDFDAVKDVSMIVEDGEYVSVIGPSGCGKTTLLKMIAGILRQDSGEIRFGGIRMDDIPIEERGVGYVFQDIALFPHMNLWENISFGPRAKGTPIERTRLVTLEMLEMMKLSGRYRDLPGNLGGGMQQKAAVARAIAPGHRLMLLDEPLSMLDARVRSELRFELRNIVKDLGLTAIHVTHDQEEAMAISDRIFVMRGGRLVEHGEPADLYFKPARLFTAYFLGESNIVPGRVEKNDGTETLLKVRHQTISASACGFELGSKVAVVVRPELIEIGASDDGNCVKGRVRSRTFEGPFMRYIIEVEDHFFLRVKAPVRAGVGRLRVGEEVGLRVRPENVRVYDFPAGGLNKEIGW